MECIGHVLDVLEELELTLSYKKSFLLLAHAGTNTRRVLKGLIHRQGQETFLRIPRLNGQSTCLPLRTKVTYLGTIMSYRLFEEATWKRAAWIAFRRLKPWLQHKAFPIAQRLYLWKTSVFTVLTYSLLASGLTVQILHSFQAVVYKQIRLIIGDHPYLTHHTHQQVFQSHGLDHPVQICCPTLPWVSANASAGAQNCCIRMMFCIPSTGGSCMTIVLSSTKFGR